MKPPSSVFVSYLHGSEEHSDRVLRLATRLRPKEVDTIWDRWNLSLGQDLTKFIYVKRAV